MGKYLKNNVKKWTLVFCSFYRDDTFLKNYRHQSLGWLREYYSMYGSAD